MSLGPPPLPISCPAPRVDYGSKAHGLSWLKAHDFRVPYAVFLPVMDSHTLKGALADPAWVAALKELLSPIEDGSFYDVAVRSSSPREDSFTHSYAGFFRTVLGRMHLPQLLDAVSDVVRSSEASPGSDASGIGVVVQKRVRAACSGIVFSSDPVSGLKNVCVVTMARGNGGRLVSGAEAGETFRIRRSGRAFLLPEKYETPLPAPHLTHVCATAKRIEARLGYPVDVEWCLSRPEAQGSLVYLLQARPVTSLTYQGPLAVPVTAREESNLPQQALSSSKVGFRLDSERAGVAVARAHVVTLTCSRKLKDQLESLEIEASPQCCAYSVVLIHPPHLRRRTVRSFVGTRTGFSLPEIDRPYSVVQEPKYPSLRECLLDLAKKTCRRYWIAAALVQEVLDPLFSGMIRKVSDGYLVEVARGHFVPKGIVPASQYLVDADGRVLKSRLARQTHRFRIVEGWVVKEPLRDDEATSVLSSPELALITKALGGVIRDANRTAEFGVVRDDDGGLRPYLIDLAHDKGTWTSGEILEGVVSPGWIVGRVVSLVSAEAVTGAMDSHLHDQAAASTNHSRPHVGNHNTIYVASSPAVSLLQLVRSLDPRRSGFVFEEGSILCHLAIILRERGIPAVIAPDISKFHPDQVVTLDARSERLNPERVWPVPS